MLRLAAVAPGTSRLLRYIRCRRRRGFSNCPQQSVIRPVRLEPVSEFTCQTPARQRQCRGDRSEFLARIAHPELEYSYCLAVTEYRHCHCVCPDFEFADGDGESRPPYRDQVMPELIRCG